MPDASEKRGGCGPIIVAAVILSLPVLYFLSSGPAYRLGEAGYLDADAYRALYWPLTQLSQLSPTFSNFWKQYLILCGC